MPSRRNREKSDAEHVGELYQRMYAVARRIPRGKVVTYGQLAELAGMPGAARLAGAAMRASTPETGIPWQRVVAKRSRTTAKIGILDPIGAAVQRSLLEAEGVRFTRSAGISLAEHGWLPLD